MKKTCNNCKISKDISFFGKDKHSKDGYTTWCKECRNKRNREYCKNNPDKKRKNNDDYKEYRKQYYNDPENKKKYRNSWLKRTYNIDHEEYDKKLEEQNNVCAICGQKETSTKAEYLAVDHNHQTGVLRGLLCNKCNRGLGYFDDNVELLQKTIDYLKQYDK